MQDAQQQAILFQARNPEELQKEVHDRYGEAVGRILERSSAQQVSVQDQQAQVQELHDAGLNGNAQSLLDAYKTHQRQFEIKSVVEDKWYHKAGRVAKDVLLAPVRGVQWAFKNHPVLSTVAVTALLGYLGFRYGIGLQQIVGRAGELLGGQGAREIIPNLTPTNPINVPPGIGPMPPANPTAPSPLTPPPGVPM